MFSQCFNVPYFHFSLPQCYQDPENDCKGTAQLKKHVFLSVTCSASLIKIEISLNGTLINTILSSSVKYRYSFTLNIK